MLTVGIRIHLSILRQSSSSFFFRFLKHNLLDRAVSAAFPCISGFRMKTDLMTIKGFADYLGVHPNTIYRLLKDKDIPSSVKYKPRAPSSLSENAPSRVSGASSRKS